MIKKLTKDKSTSKSQITENDKYKNIQKFITFSWQICDKCFRMIYISFNYINNYVTTYCFYCNKINIYDYYKFFDKINNDNPFINTPCTKCHKYFNHLENQRFYLIENKKNIFFVICSNCFNINNNIQEYKKISLFHDLFEFNEKDYKNGKDLIPSIFYQELIKINENSTYYIKYFNKYEKIINNFESALINVPISLRKIAQEKLEKGKLLIKIVKIIHENYNKYKNIISAINFSYSFESLFDLSDIRSKIKYNNNMEKSYKLIEYFLSNNKLLQIDKKGTIRKSIKLFDYNFITKKYKNKQHYIEDKNEPKEEILKDSYSNILNINFETGETIIYDLISKSCRAEFVVPIYYNYYYNNEISNINKQEILLYSYHNDKRVYFGIYDVQFKEIMENSLIDLTKTTIKKILKIIILNYGRDLFIIAKSAEKEKDNILLCFFITNFREDMLIENYEIKVEDFNLYSINYKEENIYIKTKNKLFLFNKEGKKEINIKKEITQEINPMNYRSIQIMNLKLKNVYNKNIEILNNMEKGINSIIKILSKNALLIGKVKLDDNIKNYINPYSLDKEIIFSKKYKVEYFFHTMLEIDNDYFLVICSKNINFNIIKCIFYLSLYKYKTFEEVTKIEIAQFIAEKDLFDIFTIKNSETSVKIFFYFNQSLKAIYLFEFKEQNYKIEEINS